MRRGLVLALAALCLGHSHATITNADFSSGLSGWSSTGVVSTATSYTYGNPAGGTISPTAGTRVVEMRTRTSVNRNSLASFLGTTSTALNSLVSGNATRGSAIRTTFTGTGSITFDWNFWTRDYPPYNDFAFVALSGPGISGTQLTLLSNVNAFAGPNGTNGPSNGTGWQSSTLTLPGDGVYTIGFGTMNSVDNAVNSYFYVDNLQTTCVPEPSTALAAFFALGLIFWLPNRRWRPASNQNI